MLTKQQEEKLREEWKNYSIKELDEHPLYKFLKNEPDYWLARINESLEAQRKEIVEGIESLRINNVPYKAGRSFYVGPMAPEKNRVHDMALDTILSLPSLTGKEK